MGDDADTTLEPTVKAPEPELAWSAEAETEVIDHSWRAAVGRSAAVLFVCAVVAILAAVGALIFLRVRHDAALPPRANPPYTTHPPTSTAVALPSPSTSPTPHGPRPLQFDSRGVPLMPDNPTVEELQQILVADLARPNLNITYPDAQGAAVDAQGLCAYLKSGHYSFGDVVLWVKRTHPAFTGLQPGGFVGAAVGVYCREYGYLLQNNGGVS